MNCANHPDRERVAFCQNCGKPICQECTRTVGSAVFCEPCLIARLAGTNPTADSGSYSYGSTPGAGYTASDGTIPPIPPPPVAGEPNPGLAALLGFIPGVGAMYNGQYAKGIVHLIVFAILVSLTNENGIFILFVFGWVFYQVFEAHQTARARRDGTPLPNPFGLNDLGERLGFGKAWPAGAPGQPVTPPSDPAAPPPPPGTAYPPPSSYPPYTPPSAAAWNWENHVPPMPPYGVPFSPVDPNSTYPRNRFPAGAVWLIALGGIFLIANSGLFHGFPAHWLVPVLLIGFGVWQFVRKMTEYGAPLTDDGSALYRVRLFHALRSAVWIILVGVLFLLDSFHILSWARSWPLFIIVAGVMAIFHRATVTSIAAAPYPYSPPVQAPPPPPTEATTSAPSNTHDQEGS